MSIIKILFSVRNENIHKVITIMGLKFKFKSKKLMLKQRFENVERDLRNQRRMIAQQKSMIDNLQEQVSKKLNINQAVEITEIAMLKTKYHWDDIKIPVLHNNYETVKALKQPNKSIIRFGDGEFRMMGGEGIVYQNYHPYIAEKLKEIIKIEDENLLIGIPEPYYDYPIDLAEKAKGFILGWFSKRHKNIEKYYNYNMSYYSNHISQMFPVYAKYDFENHYNLLKQIWNDKKITIITGDRVYNNIEYNIFENASEISYIYGPTENAFDEYESLKTKISETAKDNILIFALGPAGKILAYDMYQLGYRVLDLGHLIKDYDFYRKSVSMTKDEWNKYRKVFFQKD